MKSVTMYSIKNTQCACVYVYVMGYMNKTEYESEYET